MSRIFSTDATASPWRARLPLIVGAATFGLLAIVVGTRVLGVWGGPALALFGGDPNVISVTYTTEAGDGARQGVVDSPLRVAVRVPWSTGGQDSVLSSVTLQMVDEAGKPAPFGPAPSSSKEAFALKPTSEISVWEWRGSVPTAPGMYHPRVHIEALYNKARSADHDLTTAVIEAVAEAGSPLSSGYVFAQDSNIWLLSTDMKRQRRLTFFPEFFEYADKPAWSPDGKRIAFSYQPRTGPSEVPATDIWQVTPGGAPFALVTHREGESLFYPAWSADGKYLYFTSETTSLDPISGGMFDRNVSIERLDLATGERQTWASKGVEPAPSSSGPGMAYLALAPVEGDLTGLVAAPMRVMNATTGDAAAARIVVDERAYQDLYMPRVSPDGKWIAFAAVNVPPQSSRETFDFAQWLGLVPRTASAHGLPWDLFLASASGDGPNVRLTELNEDQPYPIWLDNTTIAFMGVTGLYRLSIGPDGSPTGEAQKMHAGAPHGGLSWHGP